jgi:hypothetical protein
LLYGHFYPLYNARQKQLSEQNRSAEMPLLHVSSPNCPIVEVGLRLSGPLPYWKAALDVLVVTSQHMDYLVKYHVSNPSHPVYFVVSHPLSLSFRHPNIYCSSFPGPIVTKSAQPPVKRIIPPPLKMCGVPVPIPWICIQCGTDQNPCHCKIVGPTFGFVLTVVLAVC